MCWGHLRSKQPPARQLLLAPQPGPPQGQGPTFLNNPALLSPLSLFDLGLQLHLRLRKSIGWKPYRKLSIFSLSFPVASAGVGPCHWDLPSEVLSGSDPSPSQQYGAPQLGWSPPPGNCSREGRRRGYQQVGLPQEVVRVLPQEACKQRQDCSHLRGPGPAVMPGAQILCC